MVQGASRVPQDISKKGIPSGSYLQWYDGLPSPTIFSLGCDFPGDDIEQVSISPTIYLQLFEGKLLHRVKRS
jgi:hypothetical protein